MKTSKISSNNKKLLHSKKIKFLYVILAIIIIISIIIILRYTFFVIALKKNIQERKYYLISNNLYYTNDLIEKKKEENKENILNYYKTISNYLNKKYPTLYFYIDNFNYDTLNKKNNGMIFNIYQMIDYAIVDNTMFCIDMENGNIINFYNIDNNNLIFGILEPINKINIDDVKEKVLDLAIKHKKEIFEIYDSEKIIKGEYYLKYNDENKFYYEFILNNGSYVNVDTITGNVIDYWFFNGVVI